MIDRLKSAIIRWSLGRPLPLGKRYVSEREIMWWEIWWLLSRPAFTALLAVQPGYAVAHYLAADGMVARASDWEAAAAMAAITAWLLLGVAALIGFWWWIWRQWREGGIC
ncbi:MAG TPA: hypothetical protein ENJ31_01550 [Anaerolineae bacterium]|nr:hypothetical protein [Anaerolineae bacterium]